MSLAFATSRSICRISLLTRLERQKSLGRDFQSFVPTAFKRDFHCTRAYSKEESRVTSSDRRQAGSQNRHDEQSQQQPRISNWGYLFRFFGFITWLPAVYLFAENIGSLGAIDGQSMSPTLNPNAKDKDIVLLNKYASQQLHYRIGDVVMLISPADPNLIICKRILALPGDIVSVNVSDLKQQHGEKKRMRIRIPPAHVWVEGDSSVTDAHAAANHGHGFVRPSSRDSREYGPIPMGLIFARVDMILFPFSRFGFLPDRPYMKEMQSLRKIREQRKPFGSPSGTRSPHPDDSSLSPYSVDDEWEWSTDPHGKRGLKGFEERDLMKAKDDGEEGESYAAQSSSLEEKKRARMEKREENQKAAKKFWNQISRGGRLGDDAENQKMYF